MPPPLTVCLFEGFGEYRCEGPLVSGKKLDAVRQKPLAAIYLELGVFGTVDDVVLQIA